MRAAVGGRVRRGSCLTRSLYRLKLGGATRALRARDAPVGAATPARLLNINAKRKHAVTVQDSELILLLSVPVNVLLTSVVGPKRGETRPADGDGRENEQKKQTSKYV